MDEWVIWFLLGIVFAIGEMATTGFFLAPFAGGAFVAAVFAGLGATGTPAIVVFVLVTLLLFLFVRPIARRHLTMPPSLRTGTDALIGQDALVLERIANDEGVGTVRIGGEVWTARSWDEDRVIEAGERVQVMEIRGATALVTE